MACSGDAAASAAAASPARPAYRKLNKRVQFHGLSLELIDFRSGSGNSQDLESSCWAEASSSPGAAHTAQVGHHSKALLCLLQTKCEPCRGSHATGSEHLHYENPVFKASHKPLPMLAYKHPSLQLAGKGPAVIFAHSVANLARACWILTFPWSSQKVWPSAVDALAIEGDWSAI